MKDMLIPIIILIVSLIPVLAGDPFDISDNVGEKYPISFLIMNGTTQNDNVANIYKVGFNYPELGLIYIEGQAITKVTIDALEYSYTFQDNEFINYMNVCIAYSNRWSFEVISYIHIKTNLNNNLYYGKILGTCQYFEPNDTYAIAGFHGSMGYALDILEPNYKKFYYDCPKLEEGKFCNYDHTKVLTETEMPEGFFLNDTSQKTIDKCYSSCIKCINYGNDENHNCLECIPNYYPHKLTNNYEYIQCYPFQITTLITTIPGFSLVRESLNQTKNEIIDYIDKLIKDKIPEKSYIIDGPNYMVFINPTGKYIDDSNVIIDFSECEKILKEKYPNFSFRILQINSKNSNPNCLNEDVEYMVYNQFGERIDLSCCNNVKITIQNKIDKASLDLEKILYFQNKGIDIFQLKDDFFNDICYPYSDENSDSDVILKDRVSDIYQNYSLCEKECEYEIFNNDPIYVNCSCNVKQEVSKETKEGNYKTYIKSFLYSNFGIIKCYKLVFGIKGKLKNVGFFLIGILILFHLPIYIYYFLYQINPIKNYINNEMEKYEYKTQSKDNESSNEVRTIENFVEKEDRKIKNRFKNKKLKSKFHNKENYPPKKNLNNSFYSDNYIKDKVNKQITSERDLNSVKDKNQITHYLYINNNKSVNKKYRNSFSNNYSLNERKEEEFDDCYGNKITRRSLFKIIKKESPDNKTINKKNFPLILINANNKGNHYPLESNYVLNNYDYNEAIIYDKRNFCRIFFIILISKENLLNLIFFNPPLELKPLRISIFIFNYICDLSLNAFFYLSNNISDVYHYKGAYKLLFTIMNNIIISLSSTIISFILLFIFQSLIKSS